MSVNPDLLPWVDVGTRLSIGNVSCIVVSIEHNGPDKTIHLLPEDSINKEYKRLEKLLGIGWGLPLPKEEGNERRP